MDPTLVLIGGIIVMLILVLFKDVIGYFASILWLRMLVSFDIAVGPSTLSDLIDTTKFIVRRRIAAEELFRDFATSPLILSFAREHEGEDHEHHIFLWTAGEYEYYYNLGMNVIEVVRDEDGIEYCSLRTSLCALYFYCPEREPLWAVLTALHRARNLIAYHPQHEPQLA